MTSISLAGHNASTFQDVYAMLKQNPTPLFPPAKPLDPSASDRITSLHVHPALEALLHILNCDLYSAHFLVRHMEASPQEAGMYTHGILHRIEGDYDNARAWYSDVCKAECFTSFWGEGEDVDGLSKDEEGYWTLARGQKVPVQASARHFLDSVQATRAETEKNKEGEQTLRRVEELRTKSGDEIEALVAFCVRKYGTDVWNDASTEWVGAGGGSSADLKKDMLTGSAGHRKF